MSLAVSAPGKVVLIGEYAVLAGAPALVMAADRRAAVRLRRTAQPPSVVHSRGGANATTQYRFDDHTTARRAGPALPLIEAILNELAEELDLAGAPPFVADVDTSAFIERSANGPEHKLGLGSSAALTVAFASALAEYTGRLKGQEQCWISRLISVHRRFQNGRGSGLDIAASLSGGVISYRMNGAVDRPTVAPRRLPDSFHVLAIWAGHSASTEAALERLEQWRSEEPAAHRNALSELSEIATAADDAVNAGDGGRLLATMASYGDALRRFGAASGIDIYSAAHQRIAALAREQDAVYKPCGAGGGDIGVACSDDVASLAALRQSIEDAGFRTLALAVDPVGLQVQPSLE